MRKSINLFALFCGEFQFQFHTKIFTLNEFQEHDQIGDRYVIHSYLISEWVELQLKNLGFTNIQEWFLLPPTMATDESLIGERRQAIQRRVFPPGSDH